MEHDTNLLPKWTRLLIQEQKQEIEILTRANNTLTKGHEILMNREWFTIPGPNFNDDNKYYRLWLLDRDSPHAICSLGPGDTLLIGREKKIENNKSKVV